MRSLLIFGSPLSFSIMTFTAFCQRGIDYIPLLVNVHPLLFFFCNFCCAEVPHPIQCDVDQHVLATHACVACQTARSPMYRLCLLCGIPCSHALSTVLCTRCVNPFRILTTEVRTSACALNLSPRTLSITATLCRFWRT